MKETNGKRTCGTCAACQMMLTAAESQFQCRRHPPTPILHPIGKQGPQGVQLGVTGMWPVVDPKDEASYCLDWVDPEPRI